MFYVKEKLFSLLIKFSTLVCKIETFFSFGNVGKWLLPFSPLLSIDYFWKQEERLNWLEGWVKRLYMSVLDPSGLFLLAYADSRG